MNFVLILGVALVVFYDFTNGFHDASDMVATAIASRSITPGLAITIVSIFTFLGPLLGGLAVANTIGEFVDISGVDEHIAQSIVLSGILTAISYNLVTWKLGLPSSSSNSLTSGLIGAAIFAIGSQSVHWGFAALASGKIEGFIKIVFGLLFSPLAGFIVGYLFMKASLPFLLRLSSKSKLFFVPLQYVTVSWLAFSHGTNDSQKGMGIIGMLLLANHVTRDFAIPIWAVILCASSITLGTLFGGWTIIKTVGFGIYKVKLIHSIVDQTSAAAVILGSSLIGAPTSTTQVVTASLMGVGAGEHPKHVRWQTAKTILQGWLFNIPISFLLGVFYCFLLTHIL
ncbi:inorganic phosphate transporter [Marinilongibacter aquaticus]|uniref:inorganic phosphate transporter n=1 Tax=Marinilongibacter aquaticus TaxID=2975157 RepID=UPI0021BD4CE9|nr:inorganic phosphate transporter [Marinilongibacter aquaticus]UBM58568.1 inorganic phosphate transporter [Marinilongibacter aquaticus]